MVYTRRDVGKIALATLPLVRAFGAPDSKIDGVQIGVISYSFRQMPEQSIDDIIKYMTRIGLSEVELMSNHAEADAGAPSQGGRGPGGRRQMTPEMRAAMQARAEELRKWRMSVSMDKFKDVRKKFDAAGIDLHLFCYNMQDSMTDDEIEYGFHVAKALGARAVTTSMTISMRSARALRRSARDLRRVPWARPESDPTSSPRPRAIPPPSAMSKYNGVNLDIGHFTASNQEPIAFINEHHARISHLHLKDRKKNQGPNTAWGQGDTPLKDVLLLREENRTRSRPISSTNTRRNPTPSPRSASATSSARRSW